MSQVRSQIESYVFGQVHKKPASSPNSKSIYVAVLFGPEAPTPCPWNQTGMDPIGGTKKIILLIITYNIHVYMYM